MANFGKEMRAIVAILNAEVESEHGLRNWFQEGTSIPSKQGQTKRGMAWNHARPRGDRTKEVS